MRLKKDFTRAALTQFLVRREILDGDESLYPSRIGSLLTFVIVGEGESEMTKLTRFVTYNFVHTEHGRYQRIFIT